MYSDSSSQWGGAAALHGGAVAMCRVLVTARVLGGTLALQAAVHEAYTDSGCKPFAHGHIQCRRQTLAE